jgi:hypothetical protein
MVWAQEKAPQVTLPSGKDGQGRYEMPFSDSYLSSDPRFVGSAQVRPG